MAKIFQLELFIKEMSLWKLPDTSEECDETCVEVTVFDIENVPINGYVFGKNSTMNRGQNFLFTLNAIPTAENKVFFNIYKKAYHMKKNFLGTGKIPIDAIFSDIFSQTFPNISNAQQRQQSNTYTVQSQGNLNVSPNSNSNTLQPRSNLNVNANNSNAAQPQSTLNVNKNNSKGLQKPENLSANKTTAKGAQQQGNLSANKMSAQAAQQHDHLNIISTASSISTITTVSGVSSTVSEDAAAVPSI